MKSFRIVRKRAVRGIIFAVLVLGAVRITAPAAETESKPYDLTLNTTVTGVFPRGVSYEGISLEGKTLEEAKSEIETYVSSRLMRYMTWNVLGNTYEYDGGSFATACPNYDIVNQLDDLTMSGNLVEQYKKQKDLDENPVNLDFEFTINADLILDQVQGYAGILSRSAANASVTRQSGQFIVTEAVNGISFDVNTIYNELVALISDFSTADPISYTFPYTETPAVYNSSHFNFSAVPLGSFSTSGLGDEDRRRNIELAAENMNGRVIYPGETASALNMYGAVTAENGYREAPGYNQGKVEMTIGGGVCQITTTLYNAVLRAELTVGYRKNHSMMVNYVSPGMDAMVSPKDNSDFTFVNSTNYPIYIESYVTGDSVCVNIWGVEERPASRSIGFTTEIYEVSWPAVLYNVVADDSKCQVGEVRVNYKHLVDVEVHPSLHCQSYKLVYDNGVLVETIPLNEDRYREMTGTIYRASDCNVSASVRPAEAGENAVFPYIGWTVELAITTLSGEEWPYYE